jgi:hypothetical protein
MSSTGYGSLAHSARAKQLKTAKVILWIIGILTIALGGFLFSNAEDEVDRALSAELRRVGASMETVDKAKYNEVREEVLRKAKLIYSANIGLGFLFIGCALLVSRKPVIATVTGLVLYLGGQAAIIAMDEGGPGAGIAKGLLVRILIIVALVSAVKAAIAVERQQNAEAGA